MVSVLKIGQSLNNTKFSAQNQLMADKNNDKEKIKSFANNQVKLGYTTLGAAAVAVTGSLIKNKAIRVLSALPAAMISLTLGINMLTAGKNIQKIVDAPKQPTMDKKA